MAAGPDPAAHHAGPPRKANTDEGGPGSRARPDPPMKKGKGPATAFTAGRASFRRPARAAARRMVLRRLGLGARSVARAGGDASEQGMRQMIERRLSTSIRGKHKLASCFLMLCAYTLACKLLDRESTSPASSSTVSSC